MDNGPIVTSGIILGVGLGGFIDGILLHQIFQVHGMLSAKLPLDTLVNVKINMVWDGLFSLFCWIVTIIGVIRLFVAAKNVNNVWSGKTLFGSSLLGSGIFNLVEGLIDHHLLNIHHVMEILGVSVYDYLFLASGIIFILVGLMMITSREQDKTVAIV